MDRETLWDNGRFKVVKCEDNRLIVSLRVDNLTLQIALDPQEAFDLSRTLGAFSGECPYPQINRTPIR